jgi:predicted phosphodiesterase
MMSKTQKTKLRQRLKNHKHSLEELAALQHVEVEEMRDRIQELREGGTPIESKYSREGAEKFFIDLRARQGNVFYISGKSRKKRVMRFGAASDLHFASLFHLPNTFHETMKHLEGMGVTKVYVAGDIHDGTSIYRGHDMNVVNSSLERQTDMAAEAMGRHPRLEFWGIAGNHDYSFTQKNGARPLASLEAKTENFKNLGDIAADVVYHGVRIRLLHGAGGRSYATSYPSQTYLRDLFKGLEAEDMANVPRIMVVGHYHTVFHTKDHGIHIVQPGSFQSGENEYCKRRGLTGPNGAYFVEAEYTDGFIERFRTEYIQPRCALKEKKELAEGKRVVLKK